MIERRVDQFREDQESKYYGPMSTMRFRQQPHPGQSISELSNDNISLSFQKINSQDAQSSQNLSKRQLNDQKYILNLKKTLTQSLVSTTSLISIQQQLKSFIRLFDATEWVENQKYWNEKLFLLLEVMTLFIQLILQFFLPIEVSFGLESKLIYGLICMKMFSIVLIIFTSQFTNGEQKNSKFETFKWYVEYYMMKDAICLICLLILANLELDSTIDYLTILLVLIASISQQSLAQDNKDFLKSFFNIHQPHYLLCFLVVQIVFYLNLIVCIWNKLLPQNDNDFVTNYHQAIFKVLSIIVMDSQFVPANNFEILLHNILSIIGMIFQGFIFVKMFNLLKDKRPQRNLDSFFLCNNLPTNLKLKIIQQLASQKYQPQIFQYLNLPIIKEINYYQRYSIFEKFFKGYSIQSIKNVIDNCEQINCVGGQIIVKENDLDDQSLYFIQEGIFSVELGEGKVVTTIGQGGTFGEITFFTQQIRQNTIISQGTGKLLKLQRSKFLQIIGHADQELFYYQKDKILFSKQLPTSCFCCNSQHHLVRECPHLTYQPQLNPKFYKQIQTNELEKQQRLSKQSDNIVYLRKQFKTPCSWKMDFKKIDTEYLNFIFCEQWHQKFIQQTPSNQLESDMQLPSDFTLSEYEPQIQSLILEKHKQGILDLQRNQEKDYKCQMLKQDQVPKQGQSRSQLTLNVIEESESSSQFEAYSSPPKQFCQSQDTQKSQNQRKKLKQQRKKTLLNNQQQQYISVPSLQSFTPLSSFIKAQDIPQQNQPTFMQHITFDLDRMCSYSLYYNNGNFEQKIRQGSTEKY